MLIKCRNFSNHLLVQQLLIHPHSYQVIFKGKSAVGVEYSNQNGTKVQVSARKEVILSAGGVASPQILMLSGVGPKKHLEDLQV
jgi:choline dehydrogenase